MTTRTVKEKTPVITLLHLKVSEQAGAELPDVYHQLTPHLLEGNDELTSSLLAKNRDPHSPEVYLILSHWDSLEAYKLWEAADHRADLRPLVHLVAGLRSEVFQCIG